MPRGHYLRKPKDIPTSTILRENQELRATNAHLISEMADLKLRIAELELTLAHKNLTIAKLERSRSE